MAEAAFLQQGGDFIKTLRVAWHDHRQQAGYVKLVNRIQYQGLFAFACAGGQKYRALRVATLTQGLTLNRGVCGRGGIKLQVAGDQDFARAQCA